MGRSGCCSGHSLADTESDILSIEERGPKNTDFLLYTVCHFISSWCICNKNLLSLYPRTFGVRSNLGSMLVLYVRSCYCSCWMLILDANMSPTSCGVGLYDQSANMSLTAFTGRLELVFLINPHQCY